MRYELDRRDPVFPSDLTEEQQFSLECFLEAMTLMESKGAHYDPILILDPNDDNCALEGTREMPQIAIGIPFLTQHRPLERRDLIHYFEGLEWHEDGHYVHHDRDEREALDARLSAMRKTLKHNELALDPYPEEVREDLPAEIAAQVERLLTKVAAMRAEYEAAQGEYLPMMFRQEFDADQHALERMEDPRMMIVLLEDCRDAERAAQGEGARYIEDHPAWDERLDRARTWIERHDAAAKDGSSDIQR